MLLRLTFIAALLVSPIAQGRPHPFEPLRAIHVSMDPALEASLRKMQTDPLVLGIQKIYDHYIISKTNITANIDTQIFYISYNRSCEIVRREAVQLELSRYDAVIVLLAQAVNLANGLPIEKLVSLTIHGPAQLVLDVFDLIDKYDKLASTYAQIGCDRYARQIYDFIIEHYSDGMYEKPGLRAQAGLLDLWMARH